MSAELILIVIAAFVSVALLGGWLASTVLSAQSPGRLRLQEFASAGGPDIPFSSISLDETIHSRFKQIPGIVPTSAKSLRRLRRRLAMAGYNSTRAVVV